MFGILGCTLINERRLCEVLASARCMLVCHLYRHARLVSGDISCLFYMYFNDYVQLCTCGKLKFCSVLFCYLIKISSQLGSVSVKNENEKKMFKLQSTSVF